MADGGAVKKGPLDLWFLFFKHSFIFLTAEFGGEEVHDPFFFLNLCYAFFQTVEN